MKNVPGPPMDTPVADDEGSQMGVSVKGEGLGELGRQSTIISAPFSL